MEIANQRSIENIHWVVVVQSAHIHAVYCITDSYSQGSAVCMSPIADGASGSPFLIAFFVRRLSGCKPAGEGGAGGQKWTPKIKSITDILIKNELN